MTGFNNRRTFQFITLFVFLLIFLLGCSGPKSALSQKLKNTNYNVTVNSEIGFIVQKSLSVKGRDLIVSNGGTQDHVKLHLLDHVKKRSFFLKKLSPKSKANIISFDVSKRRENIVFLDENGNIEVQNILDGNTKYSMQNVKIDGATAVFFADEKGQSIIASGKLITRYDLRKKKITAKVENNFLGVVEDNIFQSQNRQRFILGDINNEYAQVYESKTLKQIGIIKPSGPNKAFAGFGFIDQNKRIVGLTNKDNVSSELITYTFKDGIYQPTKSFALLPPTEGIHGIPFSSKLFQRAAKGSTEVILTTPTGTFGYSPEVAPPYSITKCTGTVHDFSDSSLVAVVDVQKHCVRGNLVNYESSDSDESIFFQSVIPTKTSGLFVGTYELVNVTEKGAIKFSSFDDPKSRVLLLDTNSDETGISVARLDSSENLHFEIYNTSDLSLTRKVPIEVDYFINASIHNLEYSNRGSVFYTNDSLNGVVFHRLNGSTGIIEIPDHLRVRKMYSPVSSVEGCELTLLLEEKPGVTDLFGDYYQFARFCENKLQLSENSFISEHPSTLLNTGSDRPTAVVYVSGDHPNRSFIKEWGLPIRKIDLKLPNNSNKIQRPRYFYLEQQTGDYLQFSYGALSERGHHGTIDLEDFLEVTGQKKTIQPATFNCPAPFSKANYLESSQLFSCSNAFSIELFDGETGALLTNIRVNRKKSWVSVTPEGFFNGDGDFSNLVYLTSGLEPVGLEQLFEVLFRPSLVAEKLRGDPQKIVRSESRKLKISDILKDGAPPNFEIVSLNDGDTLSQDTFDLRLKLKDIGGGFGNVHVSINGTVYSEKVTNSNFTIKNLPLDNKDNNVEVKVTNRADTFESVGKSLTLSLTDTVLNVRRPTKLHVFSIAAQRYKGDYSLAHTLKDQDTLIRTFTEGSNPANLGVSLGQIIRLPEQDATEDGIARKFRELRNSNAIQPHDIFLLHVSGHGASFDGEYYFLPIDFTHNERRLKDSVRAQGIPNKTWTNWLNGVPANKSLLIFDTCQSGTLATIQGKGSLDAVEGFERLRRNTGRTLIAGSGPQGIALEGYNEHSILTYAFLEALAKANDNGFVDEIAKSVQKRVPELSYSITQSDPEFDGYIQEARVVSNGYDFKLTEKSLKASGIDFEETPPLGSYITLEEVKVYSTPDDLIEIQKIPAFKVIKISKTEGEWVKIRSKGQSLGYVRKEKIARISF